MRLNHPLLLGLAAAALMTSGGNAADFLGNDVSGSYNYDSLFNFEGFYIGGAAGAGTFPAPGVVGTAGVVVGANFALTDAIVSGVEFQGDTLWNDTGFAGFNALLLGKVGGYLSDDLMVYGTGGGGLVDGAASYAIGAGIEMAVAEQLSVRAEGMGTGTWGVWPDGGKATVGVLWHMN